MAKKRRFFFLNKSLEQGSCNPWEQNLCLKEELQQVTRLWANYSCRLLWERRWDTGMSGMLWDWARFPRKPRNNGGGSSRMAPGSQLRSWDEAPEEPFLTGRRAEEELEMSKVKCAPCDPLLLSPNPCHWFVTGFPCLWELRKFNTGENLRDVPAVGCHFCSLLVLEILEIQWWDWLLCRARSWNQ